MRVARLDDRTLVIRSGFPLLTSLIVRLDKATGMGVFKKHGVLTNRRNMQFRLGEITDARVLKEQRGETCLPVVEVNEFWLPGQVKTKMRHCFGEENEAFRVVGVIDSVFGIE